MKSLPFDPANPSAALCRCLTVKMSGGANLPANTIDFRSSDQTLDRYSETINVSGWKLDNYKKNPVVQNAHSYWSLADTIGKSLVTEIRNDDGSYLFQRVQFAVDQNPMAKIAYQLYHGGFLSAVSVGFIPIRWENGSAEAGYRRKYLEQELLEVSAVSIPANPNALALGLKSGAVSEPDLKELVCLLKSFCNRFADHPAMAGDSGRAVHESPWLQIKSLTNTCAHALKSIR